MNMYSSSGHPMSLRKKSLEQIWRNLALHHLLTSGFSAVNGCRQNEKAIWIKALHFSRKELFEVKK